MTFTRPLRSPPSKVKGHPPKQSRPTPPHRHCEPRRVGYAWQPARWAKVNGQWQLTPGARVQ